MTSDLSLLKSTRAERLQVIAFTLDVVVVPALARFRHRHSSENFSAHFSLESGDRVNSFASLAYTDIAFFALSALTKTFLLFHRST